MKRFITQLILGITALLSVAPRAMADVDINRSFYVLRNDSVANGFVEGGEWLIEFSSRDTMGNEYDYPVAMTFKGAYYADSTFIPMQVVDSVNFVQPEAIMKPDVFRLTKEHYQYIVDTDLMTTIRFRIDCVSKIDLPKVGQKVISEIYEDPLPFGFLGQVESLKVSYDEGCIIMVCKHIKMSDVYSRLYTAKVIGDDSKNDSIQEDTPHTSGLRPLDTEQKELIGSWDLPLPDAGFVGNIFDDDPKIRLSLNPLSENTQLKLYSRSNKLTYSAYTVTVIDENHAVDHTKNIVKYSYTTTLGFSLGNGNSDELNKKWKDKYGQDEFLTFSHSFCPEIDDPAMKALVLTKDELDAKKEVHGVAKSFGHPAAYFRFDAGLELKLAFDLACKVEDNLTFDLTMGYEEYNDGIKPVFENSFSGIDFSPFADANFGYASSFNFRGGIYILLQIGAGSVIDLIIKTLIGLDVKGGASTDYIGFGKDINASEPIVRELKSQLATINTHNYFNLKAGILIDGNVNIFKGYVKSIPVLTWLRESIPLIDKWLSKLEFYKINKTGLPEYTFSERTNNGAFYGGTFTAPTDFIYDHELGLMLKDSHLSDDDTKTAAYIKLGNLSEGPTDLTFSLDRDNYKELKGIPFKAYTYLKVNNSKYCSTGHIGDFEFTYDSRVADIGGDDYTYAGIQVKVDEDALEDKDYTKSGIVVWKKGQKESNGVNIIGDENYAASFTTEFNRNMLEGYLYDIKSDVTYCAKPWVYDNKRDRYVYGKETEFLLRSLGGPKTLTAKDVTYDSALLRGCIHEEFFKYFTEDFKLHFSYWIPGVTAETSTVYDSEDFPNIRSTLQFDMLAFGLRANTEYEYRVGITLESGKFYGGDPVKFKTKNPISNLRHEAGTDFAIVYADVVTDFISEECKEITFEIVDASIDFKHAVGKIAAEGDFVVNDNGTMTIDVIFYDLNPGVKYKYRVKFETLSGYTFYSDVATLSTENVNLTATTGSASVSGNSATIKGSLSPDLVELLKSQDVKQVHFGYMQKSSDIEVGVNIDFGGMDYSTKLTGLNYETTYYYRFYAQDADGTVYEGATKSFKTGAKPTEYAEECYTLPASVDEEKVTMNGGVPSSTLTAIQNGTVKNVQYGFEIDEDKTKLTGEKPTFATGEIDPDTGTFTITKVLQPNRTYYIRAMLFINDKWVVAPEIESVKTADFDPNIIVPDV